MEQETNVHRVELWGLTGLSSEWSLILISLYSRYHNFLYLIGHVYVSKIFTWPFLPQAVGLLAHFILQTKKLTHRHEVGWLGLLTPALQSGWQSPDRPLGIPVSTTTISRLPTDYVASRNPGTCFLLLSQKYRLLFLSHFSAHSQVNPDLYLNVLFLSCILHHKFQCLNV